ncbi:unnamed protein product [Timema podura]|uniref:acid phosphatase n=1 Tax=Timema podura TaxID=61482 RepID=A0ABN7NXC9_TIMPD|nr:unnamed protein product [Timema podura]
MPHPEISGGYLPILLMRASLRLDVRMCILLFLWVAGTFQFEHGAGRSSAMTENLDKKYGPVVLANVLFRHGDRTPLTSYPRDPYANLSEWEIGWGQVTELFRHGDRTPLTSYPRDPYANLSEWEIGWGQVTEVTTPCLGMLVAEENMLGMYQEFVLGRQLRERYSRLLPLRYSSQDVYVLSSDVDRTLTAAQITSAGLYHGIKHSSPLVKGEVDDGIATQLEVSLSLGKIDVGNVLAPIPICPRYFKELKKVLKTQQLRCIARKNRKIYNYVSLNAGMKEFDLSIYDTLRVQEMYNLSLPSWTKTVYPTKLRQICHVHHVHPSRDHQGLAEIQHR